MAASEVDVSRYVNAMSCVTSRYGRPAEFDCDLRDRIKYVVFELNEHLCARWPRPFLGVRALFALADEVESDAAFDKWRYQLIHKAADSGYARAQFVLGQAYGQYGIWNTMLKNRRIGFRFQPNKVILQVSGSIMD
jgi:hypothetical protein